HADATAGAIVTSDDALAERLGFARNAVGTALAPFEAWLVLRGLETLWVRIDRGQRTAGRIARWLAERPEVTAVYWPGLDRHPGRALHARQASGPGAVLSFTTGSEARSSAIADHLRWFTRSVSFGSAHSVVTLPCRSSHASIPAGERTLPPDLVRLSIGLEDPEDLLDDLAAAFAVS
ncbi:MAG: PLP-dependent transferase, partial [Myxococcota bacterium]